jgi:hypothetical protein
MLHRNRETMIALRARHEAFRVASKVQNPRVNAPPPPQPAIPLAPATLEYAVPPEPPPQPPIDSPPSALFEVLTSDVVLSIAAIVIGIAVVLMCKYG